MGNKSTFVLLLMSVFCVQFIGIDSTQADTLAQKQAACKKQVQSSHGEGCMSKAAYDKGECVIGFQYCNNKSSNGAADPTECSRNGGQWVNGKCQATSKREQVIIEPIKSQGITQLPVTQQPQTLSTLPPSAAEINCTQAGKSWDPAKQVCNPTTATAPAVTAQQCSSYSEAKEHDVPASVSPTLKEMHCVCKYANDAGVILEYRRDYQVAGDANKCPKSAPTGQASTKDTFNEPVIACLQSAKNKINSCKKISTETINTCDAKSEKNEKIRQPVGSIMSVVTQAMHTSAVNKGAAEQCKTAGYLSAAAGYGVAEIQANCTKELNQCKSACSEVKDYDANTIVELCNKAGGPAAGEQAALEEQSEKLAEVAAGVNEECFQNKEGTAEKLLEAATQGVATYVSANQAAVQCEQTISSQPQLVPFTNTCAANPNAAGCPVNCATNPTNAQCACITDPNAAGCKGGAGSQMAGNPNGNSQNLPALAAGGTSFKPNSGSFAGGGLDLNMGDASEQNPLNQKPVADGALPQMFVPAGAANAGGGGGTAGSDGKGKNGKDGAGTEEDRGLFGGVFQNLKNAAGSLFGNSSGSSSTAKKSSTTTGAANTAGLKPVVGNKNLRGIASNGKSCFVDAKGAEFCFGKKNMDIFKMMNAQYNNQYNTLIIDK